MPLVYLDTNIYRQLGIHFANSLDYKNLVVLLQNSGNEFGLLQVVHSELMDYFKYDVFQSILNDHEKLYSRYESNPYLSNIKLPKTTKPLIDALNKLDSDLRFKKYYLKVPFIPAENLLDFLLHNKRLTRKDNTRDFLIFHTLIELCKEHREDHIIFITQDEIFKSNSIFKKIIIREKISNFHLYSSIPDFLKDYGPQLPFITEEFILNRLDIKLVENELINDVKCFPSYISEFYSQKKENEIPDIESFEIKGISVYEYYIFKDYIEGALKINVTFRVDIKAVFKPEKQKEELQAYLERIGSNLYAHFKNTFDNEWRPVFEEGSLFIFEGVIDENNQNIEGFYFIDFIPDYFSSFDLAEQLSKLPITITDGSGCPHDFDRGNGFWKDSIYDGKRSWHYKCKKCGLLHDTRVSYQA